MNCWIIMVCFITSDMVNSCDEDQLVAVSGAMNVFCVVTFNKQLRIFKS